MERCVIMSRKIADSWGMANVGEFKVLVEKQLDGNIALAEEFAQIVKPGFNMEQDEAAPFPLGLEWEQLLAYREIRYASLQELTQEQGLASTRTLWHKLRKLDLIMGKIMPLLYPVEQQMQKKYAALSETAQKKALAKWELPKGFDPSNSFPDTLYPADTAQE